MYFYFFLGGGSIFCWFVLLVSVRISEDTSLDPLAQTSLCFKQISAAIYVSTNLLPGIG